LNFGMKHEVGLDRFRVFRLKSFNSTMKHELDLGT